MLCSRDWILQVAGHLVSFIASSQCGAYSLYRLEQLRFVLIVTRLFTTLNETKRLLGRKYILHLTNFTDYLHEI